MDFAGAIKLLVIWLWLGLIGACASSTAPPPETTEVPDFAEEYRIGVGDNLNINVWRNPDLSIAVPVRPDGKITVPVVGDVMVGGVNYTSAGERATPPPEPARARDGSR